MIQCQLKLDLRPAQERLLERWLWRLTGVWNWAVRRVMLEARCGHRVRPYDFSYLLKGHYAKVGIPSDVMTGVTDGVIAAWKRYRSSVAGRPRLKGNRNRLNSIPFKRKIARPAGRRINVLGLRDLKFHPQEIPDGVIKGGRIVKRASGWYLCLFIDADPVSIPVVADGHVGIDPGFSSLLTLSTGEKIAHPRELEQSAVRLGQAQRGHRAQLAARIQERIASRRKDRNHKLTRRLVSENAVIVFSADHHAAVAHRFGKSVTSSGHSQLRQMLTYKCRSGGRRYLEVSNRNSTRACSACGSLSGPSGWAGLKVREWVCADCGSEHERDVNAARNTLALGLGMSLESHREAASGIAS